MTDQQADVLNRAENQRGLLDRARRAFEYFVQKGGVESINGTLTANGGVLEVQYLGRTLVAPARIVIIEGDLALEYTFFDQADGLPVRQFYLVDGASGKYELRSSPDSGSESRICDHDNKNAPTHILKAVCMALLVSPVMLVRPIEL